MSDIRRAIESLGLDKRCGGFCRKCDLGIQQRFDATDNKRANHLSMRSPRAVRRTLIIPNHFLDSLSC
jgi:hypothetical protein